jgi:hypothetical protein
MVMNMQNIEGKKVDGVYFGKRFTGVVESSKYISSGGILHYVIVDSPLVMESMKRNKKTTEFTRILVDNNWICHVEES